MKTRYGSPFRPVTLAPCELASVIGRTEIAPCESLEMSRGYGDNDDSFRVVINAGGFAGVPTVDDCYSMREPFRSDALNALYAEAWEHDE